MIFKCKVASLAPPPSRRGIGCLEIYEIDQKPRWKVNWAGSIAPKHHSGTYFSRGRRGRPNNFDLRVLAHFQRDLGLAKQNAATIRNNARKIVICFLLYTILQYVYEWSISSLSYKWTINSYVDILSWKRDRNHIDHVHRICVSNDEKNSYFYALDRCGVCRKTVIPSSGARKLVLQIANGKILDHTGNTSS